jgi:hypothetical protein
MLAKRDLMASVRAWTAVVNDGNSTNAGKTIPVLAYVIIGHLNMQATGP